MNKENNKFNSYLDKLESPNLDSAEKIVNDLMQAEQDIAKETLYLLKKKYEKEIRNWETLFAQKQQELLSVKSQLAENQERIKQLQAQFDAEKQDQMQLMKEKIKELRLKKQADSERWEQVSDEVRKFKEEANSAQKKYMLEQSRAGQARKTFYEQIEKLKEELNLKEDELNGIKETYLKKEQAWITEKAHFEEESNILKDQVAGLEQIIKDERQSYDRSSEKKDAKLNGLEQTYQDLTSQMNLKIQKENELQLQLSQLKAKIKEIEEDRDRVIKEKEKNSFEWNKSLKGEIEKFEKYKMEADAREASMTKDAGQQLSNLQESFKIIELQLQEEQKSKAEVETALGKKEQEIARLISQRDELVSEWKKVVADEQNNFKKRQSEILAEFNRVSQLKDDEIIRLQRSTNEISTALAEQKRLLQVEKEKTHQDSQRLQYLEEDKKKLMEQLSLKEKDWQIVLQNEQEFLKKQIEDVKSKSDSQVQSRENEIIRLKKETDILNGQISELQNKYHVEKNESSGRLENIKELENHIKILEDKYERANLEWQKKHQFLQLEKEKLNDQLHKEIQLRQSLEKKNKKSIESNKPQKEL
ncbi:MAG: hypothetical protein LHV68_01765 [Elusimicrobia bacterium]|nr:hypothetical protein [Candidatus Liberimonas magnetica]